MSDLQKVSQGRYFDETGEQATTELGCRASPLHLSDSETLDANCPHRSSAQNDSYYRNETKRSHMTQVHNQIFSHGSEYGPPSSEQSTETQLDKRPNVVKTVTPNSRLPSSSGLMHPPLSAPRGRSGRNISTISVSPSSRTRIGEFKFSMSKYSYLAFRFRSETCWLLFLAIFFKLFCHTFLDSCVKSPWSYRVLPHRNQSTSNFCRLILLRKQ
jgi:hypothetical protein